MGNDVEACLKGGGGCERGARRFIFILTERRSLSLVMFPSRLLHHHRHDDRVGGAGGGSSTSQRERSNTTLSKQFYVLNLRGEADEEIRLENFVSALLRLLFRIRAVKWKAYFTSAYRKSWGAAVFAKCGGLVCVIFDPRPTGPPRVKQSVPMRVYPWCPAHELQTKHRGFSEGSNLLHIVQSWSLHVCLLI